MPQRDLYHNVVRQALIKDGWTITDDPFALEYKGMWVYADLGAERPLAAEKAERKIVVEIKMFGAPSLMTELQKALGQYGVYRTFLKGSSPERELFLAVAMDVFHDFLQQPAIRDVLVDHRIHLLVFDPTMEEIVQWTE